jgi:hypothetical protein
MLYTGYIYIWFWFVHIEQLEIENKQYKILYETEYREKNEMFKKLEYVLTNKKENDKFE